MQKQKQKVWSNDELHVELGGSYRTGQQTALAALRTLPFILRAELNVAQLFGNDGGLTMLSFDPKAKKAGRFSDGDNGSDYDSGYDYGSDSDSSCGLWSCSCCSDCCSRSRWLAVAAWLAPLPSPSAR